MRVYDNKRWIHKRQERKVRLKHPELMHSTWCQANVLYRKYKPNKNNLIIPRLRCSPVIYCFFLLPQRYIFSIRRGPHHFLIDQPQHPKRAQQANNQNFLNNKIFYQASIQYRFFYPFAVYPILRLSSINLF